LATAGEAQLTLYSLTGSVVGSWDLGWRDSGSGTQTLDLRSQTAGIYFLVLTQQTGSGAWGMRASFKVALVK
jgi:hypothetical protein